MRDACVLICCFFHLAGKISTHGISTCGHVRISAQNSHVVSRPVQNIAWTCFFYFRTLWNPPRAPSDISFSSVSTQTQLFTMVFVSLPV
jgi:hypothetical protein